MPAVPRHLLAGCLHAHAQMEVWQGRTDAEVLRAYVDGRDPEAFAALVGRHGPMVWNVCLRQTPDRDAAEDVFQATFLVLARKAGRVRNPDALAAWLHGVALRVGRRQRAARFPLRPADGSPTAAPNPADELTARELLRVLDDELAGMGDRLRGPLVLCYLEGKTRDQAARDLGLSLATLKRRLERGREVLKARLAGRGVALPAGLLAVAASEAMLPARVHAAGVAAAAAAGQVTGRAVELAAAEVAAEWSAGLKAVVWAVGVGVLAAGMAVAARGPTAEVPAPAEPPADVAPAPAVEPAEPADPLPPGASARLGTARLRAGDGAGVLAVSADGKQLATAGAAGFVRLWDATDGRELRRFPVQAGPVRRLAFSPDGGLLAAADADGGAVWEADTGAVVRRLPGKVDGGRGHTVTALAVSADRAVLATGGADGVVRLWDMGGGGPTVRMPAHAKDVTAVAFAPDGKLLVTAGADKAVRVWDLDAGRQRTGWDGSADPVAVAVAPDGRAVAIAGLRAGVVEVRELATGKERFAVLPGSRFADSRKPTVVAFTADGKHLLTGSPNGDYAVLEAATGDPVRVRRDARVRAGGLAVAADGKAVAAVTGLAVRVWDPATGAELPASRDAAAAAHTAGLAGVAVTPDGKTVLTWEPTAVRFWDRATGRPLARAVGRQEVVGMLPDGRRYLTYALHGGRVYEREVGTGRALRDFGDHPEPVASAAASPDGRWLVTADAAGGVRLWDVAAGSEARRWQVPQCLDPGKRNRAVAFAPDSRRLAVGGDDGTVRLFDPASGQPAGTLAAGQPVYAVAFAADGKGLFTTGWMERGRGGPAGVRWWDSATGRERATFAASDGVRGGGGAVRFAASADGRLLATAGADTAARVWDVATGRELLTLYGHAAPVTGLAFTPDGRRLVTASQDSTALVWDLDRRAADPGPLRPGS